MGKKYGRELITIKNNPCIGNTTYKYDYLHIYKGENPYKLMNNIQ